MPRPKRNQPDEARIPAAERILLEALGEVDPAASRVLATTTQGATAQAAQQLAHLFPAAQVLVTTLDAHRALRLREAMNRGANNNVEVRCETDLPYSEAEADAVLMPTMKNDEAELTREWLDQAHLALRRGGKLLVSTDNPGDRWLHGELRKRFDKVSKRPGRDGVLYVCVKTAPPSKPKPQVWAEFEARWHGRTIRLVTRPGVFAHRRLDPGARALLDAMVAHTANAKTPPQRLLDIGSGSGAVAVAAALTFDNVQVHAIDANPRAVQCTQRSAELNQVSERITAELTTAETYEPTKRFDLVLANPPYYSGYRIAEAFLACASRALTPSATLLVVTKATAWYEQHLPRTYKSVEPQRHGTYTVYAAHQTKGHG